MRLYVDNFQVQNMHIQWNCYITLPTKFLHYVTAGRYRATCGNRRQRWRSVSPYKMARRHRSAVEYRSILSLLSARPSRFTTSKTPVHLVQEVGWCHRAGLDGRGKFRPPEGFEPRTVGPTDKCIRWICNGRFASSILINVDYLQNLRYTCNVHVSFPHNCC